MWPKAFTQLIELVPHVSRLLPMADRFFQSKSAGDDATRKSVESMGDRLRADLNQIAVTQAGHSEQISDVFTKVTRIAAASESGRVAMELVERRVMEVERRQRRLIALLIFALLMLAGILVVTVLMLFKLH